MLQVLCSCLLTSASIWKLGTPLNKENLGEIIFSEQAFDNRARGKYYLAILFQWYRENTSDVETMGALTFFWLAFFSVIYGSVAPHVCNDVLHCLVLMTAGGKHMSLAVSVACIPHVGPSATRRAPVLLFSLLRGGGEGEEKEKGLTTLNVKHLQLITNDFTARPIKPELINHTPFFPPRSNHHQLALKTEELRDEYSLLPTC